jgi:hypothetical protein
MGTWKRIRQMVFGGCCNKIKEIAMPEPELKSLKNKWLVVMPEVKLTPTLDNGIFLLDKHFQKFNAVRYVTSGKRDAIKQLDIIIAYAKAYDIPVNFVKEDVNVKILSSDNYVWQDVWSQLRVKGLIINPPYLASCLYDHIKNGQLIKAGTIIPATPHSRGDCFDMSAWRGNQTENEAKSVDDEAKIIQVVMDLDSEIGILSYVIERANNCLHVNLKPLNNV